MKPEDSTAWSDDGWQHIPYRSLLSSVNTTDWKALTTNNRAMRVKSLEFTIKKYLPLNEETKQIGGVTDIHTQVVTDPELMIMTDVNRLTEELLVSSLIKQVMDMIPKL